MELKPDSKLPARVNFKLLIVPYGIETIVVGSELYQLLLLIVPYGIETAAPSLPPYAPQTFNRTLWN